MIIKKSAIRITLWFAVGFTALLPGCKPKGLDVEFVEGVVTLDGRPVDDVTVSFTPVEGGSPGYAATDEQGYFKLSTLGGKPQGGTTVGTYAVSFDKIVPAGKRPTPEQMEADPEWESSGKYDTGMTRQLIPKRYVDPATSGFTVEVIRGNNRFDFELLNN